MAFELTPEVEIRNRLEPSFRDDVKKPSACCQESGRVYSGQAVHENNNFLILDEPTNHLDIDSKEVLKILILMDPALVSHDRYLSIGWLHRSWNSQKRARPLPRDHDY